jgi:hypothetical protein
MHPWCVYLVQLLLPLQDNAGQPFEHAAFERVRAELTDRFGGVTAFLRAPAQGHWQDPAGIVAKDDVVIMEVMCEDLDRRWWSRYRAQLAEDFDQQELVARAMPIEIL